MLNVCCQLMQWLILHSYEYKKLGVFHNVLYYLLNYASEITLKHLIAVADVLLWRDEKKSFTCFIALVLLFYWFFLSGRTFVSSAAYLLLLLSFILYGYSSLPPNM